MGHRRCHWCHHYEIVVILSRRPVLRVSYYCCLLKISLSLVFFFLYGRCCPWSEIIMDEVCVLGFSATRRPLLVSQFQSSNRPTEPFWCETLFTVVPLQQKTQQHTKLKVSKMKVRFWLSECIHKASSKSKIIFMCSFCRLHGEGHKLVWFWKPTIESLWFRYIVWWVHEFHSMDFRPCEC